MDSMFSTATLLVPAPLISPKDALLPMRTPSTSTAVPKDALPVVAPPSRRERGLSTVRSGLTVFPPGRRAETSVMLDICRWLRASRPRLCEVLRPSLAFCAVTTTSSRASELSARAILVSEGFFPASTSVDADTYPRQDASSIYFPGCTLVNTNLPSASADVQR